ncbi:GBS Bsp-like repeat-containing protein [Novisyntrophococcus fermenticellae]|uniref:GBS Bsp-like repeat-containing protein n=1 Tax=Novisyntrophococcus fermenticellae TaxID=2068655 RepID=UPI001E5120AB|nr:GBS Bsp-like repeat-containing protein [Novisyntrophococcus fermenticellae]
MMNNPFFDRMNPKFRVKALGRRLNTDKKSIIISRKGLGILGTIFTVLIGTLAMLLSRSIFWMLRTWNNLSMEELVYHLKSPLQGTNDGMIKDYIISCLIITVICAIVLTAVFIIIRKNRLAHHITILTTLLISTLTIILSVRHVWNTLDITTFSNNHSTYSTFIDDNYVNPQDVSLTFPESKRNLVYIYLESMESTYANKENGGAFDVNLIPELTQLSEDNENFSGGSEQLNGGISLTGTGWTVAAMFGQTSGLPLLIPIDDNSMNTQEHFFPGITALGDILNSAGYQQSLLIGSEAEFGGRKLYFTEHGNYDMWDYNYFKNNGSIPADYRVWWGFEDNRLFQFATEKLTEMSSTGQPFNLTLLTVDTHFEDGYPCPDCPNVFDDQYANVMACSSRKVAAFVHWIQQQEFYENTTIIISGDHPTMDSDFCDDVKDEYQRKVYTTYINSAVEPENNTFREYSTLDAFPTTLAAMGVTIDGNRLGLGTNLFSNIPTLIERFGVDSINSELVKKSILMEDLTSNISSGYDLHISEKSESEPAQPKITADISVTPYDYHTGKFRVTVENIQSDHEIQAIRCAVWASEDQSDLQWYESGIQSDGSYVTNVMARDFNYYESLYNVHVYAVNPLGETELIGMTTGEIN